MTDNQVTLYCNVTKVSLSRDEWIIQEDNGHGYSGMQWSTIHCACHDEPVFIPQMVDAVTNAPGGRKQWVKAGP